MSIKVLNVDIDKLTSKETVRYNGPAENRCHGLYTLIFFTRHTPHGEVQEDTNAIHINLSLEALIQLKARVDASLQHMITH